MKNLVLVGFMGTGKSEIGRAVAQRLGLCFLDTDAMVEARDGRPISRIFEESGEGYFRHLESAAVAEAASHKRAVIATGGGALGRPENVKALKETGVLVCLTARPDVILRRVGSQAVDRPLLRCSDPLGRIEALLAARAKDYAKADVQIDTSDMSFEQAVEAVLSAWRALGGAEVSRTDRRPCTSGIAAKCPRCGTLVIVAQVQGDHCPGCGAEFALFRSHEQDAAQDYLSVLTGRKHVVTLEDGTTIIAHD